MVRPLRSSAIAFAISLGLTVFPSGPGFSQSPEYTNALNRMVARPQDPEAAFQFAQVASAEGRFREAITALERVLILFPDLANIKLELGVLYLRLGQSAIAERFIREAIASPDAPPEVQARAAELLEIAELGNQRFVVANTVSTGVTFDTNANFGPETGVIPDDTGQSDGSIFARISSRFSYDLGYQEGHRLIGGIDLSTRHYFEQSRLDSQRVGLSFGAAFNAAGDSTRPATFSATLDGAYYWRDGEEYLSEIGPTFSYAFGLSDETSAEVSAYYRDQNFINTATVTANDLRDGHIMGVAARVRHTLSETDALTFGSTFAQKDAEAGFEAYDEVAVTASYTTIRPGLLDIGGDDWRYGVRARFGMQDYAEADPAAPILDREEVNSYFLAGSAEIPFENDLSVLVEVGVNGTSSNYDFNDFDNEFISFTLTKSF